MRKLTGRENIYVSVNGDITDDNIVDVLTKCFEIHNRNVSDIKYLRKYHKGDQPILRRKKSVRPEINEKVVENHAAEIVSFKVGYIWGTPVQYVQRGKTGGDDETLNNDNRVSVINEMMYEQSKAEKDLDLGEDLNIAGVGYRMVLPKDDGGGEIAPFDVLNLQPETAFVAKSNDAYRKPILGVTYSVDKDSQKTDITVYSDKYEWRLTGGIGGNGITIKEKGVANPMGINPIVEYENNKSRMGSFEVVIGILDAINVATSDRINDVAQFVQSLLWLHNCQLSEEAFATIYERGGIQTTSDATQDAKIAYLEQPMNQAEVQTLIDSLYQRMLTIAGVPDRQANTGSGNTGAAIQIATGWSTAEAHARTTETLFAKAEKQMLQRVIKVLQIIDVEDVPDMSSIKISDIDVKFSRNRNDNMLVKTQGLLNQLTAGVHPLTALQTCGLYSDPEQVWQDSMAGMEKWLSEPEEDMEDEVLEGQENPSEQILV